MAVYLIVGASRGIGLEFAKQILENQKDSKVIAGARNIKDNAGFKALFDKFATRFDTVQIDVESEQSVKAAAESVSKKHPEGIDYLINNAAILGKPENTADEFSRVYNTNVAGIYRTIAAFLPQVKKSSKKTIVNISSLAGSITGAKLVSEFYQKIVPGGPSCYAYRISKAALNALTATLAADLTGDSVIVISLHPGTVETDMFYDNGGSKDLVSKLGIIQVDESARDQLKVIHNLTSADSGKFFNYTGEVNPW